jgi:hypothetical protein
MDGLRSKMLSRRRSPEHQRHVRIRYRELDLVSSADADLECRLRRIRLEGAIASIPRNQADRAVQLKAL